MSTKDINQILGNLGLKAASRRVLSFLLASGVSPVSKISFDLNMPKSTIYDAVEELIGKSLVIEYNSNNTKEYGIIDPKQLARIHDEKILQLKKDQEELVKIIANTKKIEASVKPKIKFYAGQEGVKQVFRDSLWNDRDKISYIMWPTKDLFKLMGLEFSKWHSQDRIKHKVFIKVIRKASDRDFHKMEGAKELLAFDGWVKLCEEREAPKNVNWQMGFWIYGNKCVFASAGKEQIALSIESKEFSELMLALFNEMWEVSK
jgi:sugar-specific transcriptional regulator TrmB